jgi:hypothetical protein
VIVDVTADVVQMRRLLDRILPLPCVILLTSSGPRPTAPAQLAGLAFLPKADICRAAIQDHGGGPERRVH